MKNQKGFIQIPLLITVVVGILVLGGASYVGIKQYQNSQKEKAEVQAQAEIQQKALEKAQAEIEKLKTESSATKQSQQALEKTIKSNQQRPQETTISAAEIQKYLTGVVKIECVDAMGSGSLWNFSDVGYTVLTNKHVIEKPYPKGHCIVTVDSIDRSKQSGDFYAIGIYGIYPDYGIHSNLINQSLDIQALKIEKFIISDTPTGFSLINNLNYEISNLPECKTEMPIGSPVIIIGYPAFTQTEVKILGNVQTEAARTITNGVISAYDSTVTGIFGNLPYSNYFVSAKIDSGNSGGIAFSKSQGNLCVLGVPTWISVGNYETQGLVQNINNIFRK